VVFIPAATAAAWVNEASGEKRPTNRASSHLRTLPIAELSKSDRGEARGWVWRGKDGDSSANAAPLKELPPEMRLPPAARKDRDDLFRDALDGFERRS
jgi:hypothetical protein